MSVQKISEKQKKRKNQTSVCTDTWNKLFYQRKMQISICGNKISNAPDNEKSHKRCPNEKERQMNLRHFNLFKAPAGSALLDNSYVRGLMVSSPLLCFHLVDLYLSPCNSDNYPKHVILVMVRMCSTSTQLVPKQPSPLVLKTIKKVPDQSQGLHTWNNCFNLRSIHQ